jgi:hypothetical protein
MYKILVFNGGVYRFDEIVEFVEDSGGIIIKRDEFHISRGAYFISQEIHVIIVLPEEDLEELKIFVKDLKGDIVDLEVENEQRIAIISLVPVYNLLSRVETWVDLETLKAMVECPCLIDVCKEFEDFSCTQELEKTLESMCRMEIAENRLNSQTKEYRLKNG